MKQTLELIEKYEKQKHDIQESIKILKTDISDLKEGRLDRIAVRQAISPLASNAGCFKVEKDLEDFISMLVSYNLIEK